MPGNPFGRCQLSWEPWQCQPSRFPPSPANQGFLPPLSAQPVLYSPCLHRCTRRDAHQPPPSGPAPPQPPPSTARAPRTESHPAQRGAGCLHRGPGSIPQRLQHQGSLPFPGWQIPGYPTQHPAPQTPALILRLHRKQLRTAVSQPASPRCQDPGREPCATRSMGAEDQGGTSFVRPPS
ncbi:PREDICTED: basic proline-rich protein-like [Nipponia nippon]|uniref:basic proline-rich protein-like n=1 Tax=Nipponia nippon TaxID=128390 RepID=UPI00051195DA|nr:PREDICTED: basic proline-rich protein-like [Nipponia nippon]